MAGTDDYVFARDYAEGLRLETQHLLWNIHNGYTINPNIPITPQTKIADLGTGTGVWLLDVATQVPPTVQLDGFDISDGQFPHKSNIPDNVNFRITDALSKVPDDLVEIYDVVHIRYLGPIVKGGNAEPIIQHAMQLLKTGGYLQWEEADLSRNKLCIKGPEAEAFYAFASIGYNALNFTFSWVEDLPHRLNQAGFEMLQFRSEQFPQAMAPLVTRTFVLSHVAGIASFYKTGYESLPSRHEADALLAALIGAVKNGAAIYPTQVSLLARKSAAASWTTFI
ncbi:S-adenosyl-L-methionine-dependent methyltransferase [Trichoderma pleuroticola]